MKALYQLHGALNLTYIFIYEVKQNRERGIDPLRDRERWDRTGGAEQERLRYIGEEISVSLGEC